MPLKMEQRRREPTEKAERQADQPESAPGPGQPHDPGNDGGGGQHDGQLQGARAELQHVVHGQRMIAPLLRGLGLGGELPAALLGRRLRLVAVGRGAPGLDAALYGVGTLRRGNEQLGGFRCGPQRSKLKGSMP